MGVRRNDKGLRFAMGRLRELAGRENHLKADDLHELMRVHESTSIRLNAELMAAAALARTESRTGSSHRRLDFPRSDDTDWNRFVTVEKGADAPRVNTLPANVPLSAGFARNTGSTGLHRENADTELAHAD